MRIGDFVRAELVVIGVQARDTRGVIAELTQRLQGEPGVREQLESALWEREQIHSTALSAGIAVPHTTLAGLSQPLLCIGTLDDPVPYGAVSVPVRLVFLLLSPPEQTQLHIKLLARIARVARQPQFVERLLAARTPGALLHALEQEEFEV